jgi:hypothetical protein
MGKHSFYRIINIIILPVSILIAIQVIGLLIVAITNPAFLLFEFVLACIPIYAFTANYFYNKSIRKEEQSKSSLKEWIKANAVVSIIFSVFSIFTCLILLTVLNDPKLFNEVWKQLPADATTQITQNEFRKKMQVLCYILLPFSILLLTHIIITFGLLSKYKHRFGDSTNDPQ